MPVTTRAGCATDDTIGSSIAASDPSRRLRSAARRAVCRLASAHSPNSASSSFFSSATMAALSALPAVKQRLAVASSCSLRMPNCVWSSLVAWSSAQSFSDFMADDTAKSPMAACMVSTAAVASPGMVRRVAWLRWSVNFRKLMFCIMSGFVYA